MEGRRAMERRTSSRIRHGQPKPPPKRTPRTFSQRFARSSVVLQHEADRVDVPGRGTAVVLPREVRLEAPRLRQPDLDADLVQLAIPAVEPRVVEGFRLRVRHHHRAADVELALEAEPVSIA